MERTDARGKESEGREEGGGIITKIRTALERNVKRGTETCFYMEPDRLGVRINSRKKKGVDAG